jgi:hypothetical protein
MAGMDLPVRREWPAWSLGLIPACSTAGFTASVTDWGVSLVRQIEPVLVESRFAGGVRAARHCVSFPFHSVGIGGPPLRTSMAGSGRARLEAYQT